MTAIASATLVLASAALSFSAVLTKNATIDEPIHLVAALRELRNGDYRQDVASPPLWKLWAALGDTGLAMHLPARGPMAGDVFFAPDDEPMLCLRTLFQMPGTNGARLVNRARAMMLILGMATGGLVAAWAYRLGGPAAAVAATAVFTLDPTVLAHAPLVKSDLPEGLMLLVVVWLTWLAGRQLTVARGVALGLACGAAVNTKFSGLLAGPVVAGLLAMRALGPTPWPAFGRSVTTRPGRLGVAVGTACLAAVFCVMVTWGCYRFRYRPAPSPVAAVDMPAVYDRLRHASTAAALGRHATTAEVAARPDPPLLRCVRFADRHRLLPQAFLAGLVHQSAAVGVWPAYLDGRVYFDGRTAYYPLAFLYKTPLAELAAIGLAGIVGLATVGQLRGDRLWSAACVAVPAVAIGGSALLAPLNVGLRSVLPLYPFAAVAVGCATAAAWRSRPRVTAVIAGGLLIVQLATVARAWPDYIPFFNAAVGGPTEGLGHLADSNLDWGQDVAALADWQSAHPGVPIYADLFTAVDPAFYGIHCDWLFVPDGAGHVRVNLPDRPAVIAVSATHLAGLYVGADQRRFLARLVQRPPREVLHGTIYLYDYRP
jgi:hypothetical protein